ncbi:MAG: hypothetical protein DRQ08_08420 [Candidatus Latescibacterota bacterium]|nr:MAG: hypothetical protein DRQ08_08420 [Candidatus Latescibacterota bacterium]
MGGLVEFFLKGGPFMYPLLLWSIMVVGFFIERLITFLRSRKVEEIRRITDQVIDMINRDVPLDELERTCRRFGRMEGEVLSEGIARFRFISTEERTPEEMRAELNGTVERSSLGYFRRYLDVVNFLASTSVLLGLLGTVRGMIVAFAQIAEKGLGEPTIVARGISEALITTVTGLSIAVPALAIYAYFDGRATTKAIQFEPYGHLFVDALMRRWGRMKQAA